MKTPATFISEMAEYISMPEVYTEIRQLLKNPDSQISDFVKAIEHDSMLTIRILRIANSQFFGFARKVKNLEQALNLIGMIQLHDLLLCSLCIRSFTTVPAQIFNLNAFWQYSIECGIAARTIAQYSALPVGNQYFTLGLLHEVGHAAMYTKTPDLALRALEESRKQHLPIEQLERELLGFDYTRIGCSLMQFWQLPENYQQVASHHLSPQKAAQKYRYEIQIIHMAHTMRQDPAGSHQELISSSRENFPQLKSLPSNINDIIIQEINENANSVLTMLWPSGTQDTTTKHNPETDE